MVASSCADCAQWASGPLRPSLSFRYTHRLPTSVTLRKCRRCAISKPTGQTYPSQILPNGRTQVVCPMCVPALDLILITLQRYASRRPGCRVQHYGPIDEKQHHAVLHSRLALVVSASKKGRLRCCKRPKSREETPKEGSDSGRATAHLI